MSARTALLILASITTMSWCSVAAIAQEADEREIVIAEQALPDALKLVADEFGLQLAFFSELAEEVEAPALNGSYTQDQALEALLAETMLEYGYIDNDTVVVRASASSDGDERSSDSGNSATTPGPMLTVQASTNNSGAQTGSSTAAGRKSEIGSGSISGKVTDARTGANLKGALVTLEGTGQTTRTDDLGNFRFPSIGAGTHTVRISYLGFADRLVSLDVVANQVVQQDFQLSGLLEEIVVYGSRSARAQSLNLERTAENASTVLTSDLLGGFSDVTISEALRRAPGVAFVPDFNTGDGANVIIRGLGPNLNQIQLNGVRLPAERNDRGADISGILAESIDSVTISKTLLPSQDSTGAGGLVEIETKSPLDRPRRFATFGIENGGIGNDLTEDLLVSGLVSGTFGADDDWGASLSVEYRDREVTNIRNSLFVQVPEYLPAGESSLSTIDPRTPFPFEPGLVTANVINSQAFESTTEDETLSITGAFDKHFGNHTDIRLDVTHNDRNSSRFSRETTVGALGSTYTLAPIDELGGEMRAALTVEDIFGPFFATGIIDRISRGGLYVPQSERQTTTFSLRGKTAVEKWSFGYGLGYSYGELETGPVFSANIFNTALGFFGPIDPAFLTSEVLDNTRGGRVVSVFSPLSPGGGNEFLLPGFTQAGIDFYNDVNSIGFAPSTLTEGSEANNGRSSLNVSVRRNFTHDHLRYVEVGINFEAADFENNGSLRTSRISQLSGTAGDLGLEFGPGILTRVGAAFDFAGLTRASTDSLLANLDGLQADGLLAIDVTEADLERALIETEEQELAAYIQGRVDIGKLELIGGLRFVDTEIESEFFSGPRLIDQFGVAVPGFTDQFSQRVTDTASQTEALPRLLANYRMSENMIWRAGYFATVARPALRDVTKRQSVTLDLEPNQGPNNNQPLLQVDQGNPDLKPAFTHSFDISWEWYATYIGVIKISGFYKRIENPLQTNNAQGDLDLLPADLALPDAPEFNSLPDNVFVSVSQPVNDPEDADIWGAEIAVERQFPNLPGLWSGLGVYANYTYTDSARNFLFRDSGLPEGQVVIEDVPFDGSPKHSGTVAVSYSKYGFDSRLAYSAQDRRLANYLAFGLHNYDEVYDTLDFRIDYLLPVERAQIRLFLRGDDLLRSEDDASLQNSIGGEDGVPKYYTGTRYFGGRSIVLGIRASF